MYLALLMIKEDEDKAICSSQAEVDEVETKYNAVPPAAQVPYLAYVSFLPLDRWTASAAYRQHSVVSNGTRAP